MLREEYRREQFAADSNMYLNRPKMPHEGPWENLGGARRGTTSFPTDSKADWLQPQEREEAIGLKVGSKCIERRFSGKGDSRSPGRWPNHSRIGEDVEMLPNKTNPRKAPQEYCKEHEEPDPKLQSGSTQCRTAGQPSLAS